ncbi:MAG: SLC13 family permease [Pyrinomonadaceae bacterium]
MLQHWWQPENIKAVLAVLIVVAALYGFVSERIPPDVVALLALLALLLTGILTPTEAFSGFSHPAVISVAAVVVLSAGVERTGVFSWIARRTLTQLGGSEWRMILAIMLATTFLSAWINNTAAVAIFIPIVIEACRRSGIGPGRILMPMSHAATFGGMCTLIGTSTNLVAHEFARSHGLPGFSMFSFAMIGLPMSIAGILFIVLIGRHFLPKGDARNAGEPLDSGNYLGEAVVTAESPWIGREINAATLALDFELELLGVVRDGQIMNLHAPLPRYAARDSLWVSGPLDKLLALLNEGGLEFDRPTSGEKRSLFPPPSDDPTEPPESAAEPKDDDEINLSLAEVVVLAPSGLIGQTLQKARFGERFDAVVLALRRRDAVRGSVATTRLRAGDVLVVEGKDEALRALAKTRGFLVIGAPAYPERRARKLIIAVATLVAVIMVVALDLLPIVTAATAGCAVLMLTGCLTPREAYRSIDLSIIFVLAGSLAMGMALDKTGITALVAQGLGGLTAGPHLVLAIFFLIAVLVSELMSNSGTVALLGPVAVSTAVHLGMNPMALLVAVTFGASAAFAMPIGYQTSLMIYGPGGYRTKDFLKLGIVLDLLLAAIAVTLIPMFWPLMKQ